MTAPSARQRDTVPESTTANLSAGNTSNLRGGMTEVSNAPMHAGGRRRSQRVLMQVGVQVHGTDTQGTPFDEETQTLAVNAHGGRVLLKARVTSGGKVILKNKSTGEEQECHVAFLGPVREGRAEIGLEFSAPRPQFWRIAFPPEDWNPHNPEARTISNSRPKAR
jgi:hypothetical protein